VDGRTHVFTRLESKADQLIVHTAAAPLQLQLSDVLKLDFDNPAGELMSRPGQQVVVTDDGSLVGLAGGAVADGKLNARLSCGSSAAISLDRLARWLRTRPQERPADLEARVLALKLSRSDRDCIVVSKTPDQWVAVLGILISAGDDSLSFQYEGVETRFESATVPILLAARTTPAPGGVIGDLFTTDGSQLGFSALEFTAQGAAMQTPWAGKLTIPLASVSTVRLTSGRASQLSDLEPAEVRQTGFFDERFGPRRNCSSAGTPIRMNGLTYARGLGLHSQCEVTYELGGAYRFFSALAGVDDTGLGSAFLSVLADGKPVVARVRLAHGAAPQPVRAELAGARRLTLQVDFGEGTFGAGERVDLADAILVK
jgi:hypothetical protein